MKVRFAFIPKNHPHRFVTLWPMQEPPGGSASDELVDASCRDGAIVALQFLLEAGANPKHRHPRTGHTALSAAAHAGQAANIELLLEAGAAVQQRPHNPLHAACQRGHVECTRMLLAAHATPDFREDNGSTALYNACGNGQLECASLLLAAGASPDLAMHEGATPLLIACEKGDAACVVKLIESGATVDLGFPMDSSDVKPPSDDGREPRSPGMRPLHLCSLAGSVDCARALVSAGAPVASITCEGYTPLHLVAGFGEEVDDLPRLLLDAGAWLDQMDGNGRTAKELAERRELSELGGPFVRFVDRMKAKEWEREGISAYALALNEGFLIPNMPRVRIQGLVARADLNGKPGTLLSWSFDSTPCVVNENGSTSRGAGRWAVQCEGCERGVLVRPDRLELLLGEEAAPDAEDICVICHDDEMPDHGEHFTGAVDYVYQPCCGQSLCGRCIRKWWRSSKIKCCPHCRVASPSCERDAAPLLKKRACVGDPHAKMLLANMTISKMPDLEQAQTRARALLAEAATAGFTPAMCELADDYLQGRKGLSQNEAEAIRWYEKAASVGSVLAHTGLAQICFNTHDETKQSSTKGMALLIRAAELGDLGAQACLSETCVKEERSHTTLT